MRGVDEAEDPRPEVGGSDFEYVAPRELSLHERIELIDPRFGISSHEAEVMELFIVKKDPWNAGSRRNLVCVWNASIPAVGCGRARAAVNDEAVSARWLAEAG